jgi:hypothetical protein
MLENFSFGLPSQKTPVVLATQEAEIRRIVFGTQSWQMSSAGLYLEKNPSKKGAVDWLKTSPSTNKKSLK